MLNLLSVNALHLLLVYSLAELCVLKVIGCLHMQSQFYCASYWTRVPCVIVAMLTAVPFMLDNCIILQVTRDKSFIHIETATTIDII